MICGYIPKIEDKQVLNELKRKKIKFTDSFRKETEINLLIGADVLGKLLTGNSVELESGLTAVETKLGWTVFGKGSCAKDNIVTTLSMHSMNIPVNKLWELEVLGISSPTEIEKQKTELSLNDFNNRIKILPDGRYEVEPPWNLYAISDYNKMIRVFSWILRFVNNCTLLNGKCKDSELSQSEIENSEKNLIRLVQSYYLPDAKSSNYIETYIDDEGIFFLRVKTKILNRDDERSFLYPILLPEKCV
ncbi:DUF1758 domain-containing protein [Trichonephila clavipes]|nr:DUF1758 domain-containing protein [Trichonephila clavipes]